MTKTGNNGYTLQLCGGQLVDTQSNPNHCGSCANSCNSGEKCLNGACTTASCPVDQCSAGNNKVACVDQNTNPLHCGQCGENCGQGRVCVNGNCEQFAPATPCNSCPCNAVCQDLFGNGTACCPGLGGSSQPICVNNSNQCPG
jgi:hypothetical protein